MFTKEERQLGKQRLQKLTDWLRENPQDKWNMMDFRWCAASHIKKVLGDDVKMFHTSIYSYFGMTLQEQLDYNDTDFNEALFANHLNQEDQVKFMQQFIDTFPGYM